MKRISSFILAAALLAGIAGCSSGQTETPKETTVPVTTQAPAQPAPPAEEGTAGQRNAKKAAERYLDVLPFSKAGLVKQLEFDKYQTGDAVWAVEHLTVDWVDQAKRKAESYVEVMPFSHSKLVDQLVFDGFTPEEAEQGVTLAGL